MVSFWTCSRLPDLSSDLAFISSHRNNPLGGAVRNGLPLKSNIS